MRLYSAVNSIPSLVLTLWLLGNCQANIILYDSNGFEGFSVGNAVGQFGWFNENDAVYTIQSDVTNGGVRALAVTRDTLTSDRAFMSSLNFIPSSGQTVTIEADIARTLDAVTPSFGFAVDVLDGNLERITRFGLRNDSGDIRGFYTAIDPNTNAVTNFMATSQVFASGEFVVFRAELNFDSQTVDLYINGTSVTGSSNIAFATNSLVSTLRDIGFQISSNSSANDVGYLDNLRVTAVPEPASLLLVGLGTCGLLLRRRGLNS